MAKEKKSSVDNMRAFATEEALAEELDLDALIQARQASKDPWINKNLADQGLEAYLALRSQPYPYPFWEAFNQHNTLFPNKGALSSPHFPRHETSLNAAPKPTFTGSSQASLKDSGKTPSKKTEKPL